MEPPILDTSAFEAFEAAGWQQQAAGYDAFFGAITSRTVDALLDAAGVAAGSRLLDVGTGPGHVAGRATERGAEATGVDIADAMVTLARATWPGVTFQTADAHELPFPAGSFDAVVGNFSILHLGRPEQAVGEFARVLAPGGKVAVTVWDKAERSPLLGAVASAMNSCGASPPEDIPEGPPFFRFAEDEELRSLLRGGGLVEASVETVEFTHAVADAAEVWRAILNGTVRTSALVVRQPDEVQRRIQSAFVEILESYRRGSVLELPFSVKLGAATKPAR